MRTSNKILLGIFITMLAVLTAIHGAIYAKYKSNNFITTARLHDERYDRYNIDGVHSVELTGIEHVTILPSDSARLEMEKTGSQKSRYTFVNGVLSIKGDTTITRSDGSTSRERTYQDIIIYLPDTQHIKSDYCRLSVRGAGNPSGAFSLQLELKDSELQLGYNERQDTTANNFQRVVVTKANGGTVNVFQDASVKYFELNLQSASFNDGGASFDSLTVSTDNSSSISISGKNIPRTKFISKP